MSVRDVAAYCPVQAEEYCEGRGIECPYLLQCLGEAANTSVCPMQPQLQRLKEVVCSLGLDSSDPSGSDESGG